LLRLPCPVTTAYCRASLMADSFASEPPETKKARSKPSPASAQTPSASAMLCSLSKKRG
jgi:hypothetical protein